EDAHNVQVKAEVEFGRLADARGVVQGSIDGAQGCDVVFLDQLGQDVDGTHFDEIAEALDVPEGASRDVQRVEREEIERPFHAVVDNGGAHFGAHRNHAISLEDAHGLAHRIAA